MSWKIRRAVREDISALVEFQIQMAWETESFELDRDTVNAGATALFDDPNKGHYWVAEGADCLVGCLLTLPEWSEWRNGQVWWIHSVYVTPNARRQSVFRTMYKHLQQVVMDDPTSRGLRLYVDKRNDKAKAVYRSLAMNDEHYALFEWMPYDSPDSDSFVGIDGGVDGGGYDAVPEGPAK